MKTFFQRAMERNMLSGSKIIFISDATQVMKTAEGSVKDITVGEQVTALGTANSDGSISAQSVQIRPTPPPIQQ